MKLAIDAMGGDYAPKAIIEAVNESARTHPTVTFTLFGDQTQIEAFLTPNSNIEIVHTMDKIASDAEPVKAVRRQKNASMVLAAQSVKDGESDAFISAGNSGALLASGLLIVGRLKGIDRPALMPIIPAFSKDHQHFILADAGANADCKPKNLLQFAILGHCYAKQYLKIANPRIGLINNGAEASKGNELSKEAFALLKEEKELNFIGNVEARYLLNGVCDVAVTDGFTGNAILKTTEGTALTLFKELKQAVLTSGIRGKLGGLLLKPALKQLDSSLDYQKGGGALLLGLKAPVIKTHGSAQSETVIATLEQAISIIDSHIVSSVEEALTVANSSI